MDSNYNQIIKAALSCWNDYEPASKECESVGVDSSWNKRSFQGLDLYAVDAVAVNSKNEILGTEWDTGLRIVRKEMLESKALFMESKVTATALESNDVDIISIDGSLASRFIKNKPDNMMQILDILKKKKNVIFMSKNSDTKRQFDFMGAKAADIFYFNHIGKSSAGFSTPFENKQAIPEYGNIIEIYARLKECTPITKIEISDMTISQINNAEIKKILNFLSFHTVSGYPYCLKLAHQNCKITKRDIDRLVGFFGLKNEMQSRDPLNE
jgi:NurA-like 5'-3' nuclease